MPSRPHSLFPFDPFQLKTMNHSLLLAQTVSAKRGLLLGQVEVWRYRTIPPNPGLVYPETFTETYQSAEALVESLLGEFHCAFYFLLIRTQPATRPVASISCNACTFVCYFVCHSVQIAKFLRGLGIMMMATMMTTTTKKMNPKSISNITT